jgi:predicted glutamine amidotransferase
MNCNTPTDIVFSFTGFATRGGRTDEHKDGWGIAFLRVMAYVILSIINPQSAHRWLI